MSQISISSSETALWHALIGKAEFHAQQLLPEGVENYLVRLFIRFEREESMHCQIKAAEVDKINAELKLQRLGDQCLLLSGFYPEASDEYGIAVDEFMAMGSEAYKKLAMLGNANAIIFEYLTENFEQLSEMLRYISADRSPTAEEKNKTNTYSHKEASTGSFKSLEQVRFSRPTSYRALH